MWLYDFKKTDTVSVFLEMAQSNSFAFCLDIKGYTSTGYSACLRSLIRLHFVLGCRCCTRFHMSRSSGSHRDKKGRHYHHSLSTTSCCIPMYIESHMAHCYLQSFRHNPMHRQMSVRRSHFGGCTQHCK